MNSPWKGKKVAVIGTGVEGIACAEWLVKQDAEVTLLDKREDSQIVKHIEIKQVFGEEYLKNLDQYDIIVRSPGVKRDLPEITDAEKKGKVVTSQTKFFFDLCPAPIIGVTGTKGKGTTSALIYEMLRKEGMDVYLGGNIGIPPLHFLDKLKLSSWVILELSSFQLEDLQKSPHIAVILMIVPEHLGRDTFGTQNYHDSVDEYVSAKRNILHWQNPQDYAIINRDYSASRESDMHTDAKVFQVSREREAVGDGCFTRQARVMIRKDGKEEEIIDVSEILLPGKHNLENVCAAVMAADLAGASKKSIQTVLRQFRGLEHRLELVGDVAGVRYYDDSFSTTPETAIAAIEAFDAPVIIILGGSSKNSDFTKLGELISTRVNIKAVIGIGTEWPRIKENLQMVNGPTSRLLRRPALRRRLPLRQVEDEASRRGERSFEGRVKLRGASKWQMVEGCKNMQEIVQKAAEIAEVGDVVLLSPACASFDMFKNYKERGEQFKKEVLRL